MKSLTSMSLLFCLFACSSSFADTDFEVLGGGITYHVIDPGSNDAHFAHIISNDNRLIANPMFGLTLGEHDDRIFQSGTIFGGENSIGNSMFGGIYERGYQVGNWQLGLAVGAYEQNDNQYREKGIEPFRLTEVNGTGIVPVLGAAINYKINFSEQFYIKLNNVISPVITNSTISFGWSL